VTKPFFKTRIALISLGCLALLSTQGCTVEEDYSGVSDTAVVGIVDIGGGYGGGYHRDGGFHGGGGDRGGFHGGGERGGGGDHGGGHRRSVEDNNLESIQAQTDDSATPSVGSVLASKFNLPEESANHLIAALQSAKAGQIDDLVSLGINSQEIQLLAQGKMMSDQGLQVVANNLKQDSNDTREMIQAIMDSAARQKSSLCQAASESSKGNIPSICK
jgi:hypothetical protein